MGEGRDQRNVTLTRGFWMGDTPVTQGLYAAAMGWNPSKFRSAFSVDLPVERISWNDAQELVVAANRLTSPDSFRLPTEAEWEYAARAGTTGGRYGPVDEISWTRGNSFYRPHSVGQKRPNPWGLYDTLGNVWEWVQDRYDDYKTGELFDPRGPLSGPSLGERVFRGGGWNHGAAEAWAPLRRLSPPGGRSQDLGFRLLRTAP
jgi:formylglycine-generating enzyme required for sulfatase activity